MCGIFGITGYKEQDNFSKYALMLKHRGPDAFGEYYNNEDSLYMAHCRLSIIDLSIEGRQPMSNEDGSVWLTFNGEIYNFQELRAELEKLGHIFKSHSDTEVIIHGYEEWDIDCLKRFCGMFAFALWDEKCKRLFIARDRLGIKPLYYAMIADNFVFASEPKAIISLPFYKKGVNSNALISYLLYSYINGEDSIWDGVKQLNPGFYLIYDVEKRKLTKKRYWSLEPQKKRWSEIDAVDCMNELMETSMRQHLISDVPIGVLLSGGIDSTFVTEYASRLSPGIRTFNVGFEGWAMNELRDSKVVAGYLNTSHYEDYVSHDNFEKLEKLFQFYDEPLGDNSIFPTYLVCGNARKHTTVALSGDGGDELFGGYNWYTEIEEYPAWRKSAFLISGIINALGMQNSFIGKKSNQLEYYRILTTPCFSIDELKELFPNKLSVKLPEAETDLLSKDFREKLSKFKRWQYLDAMTYLPNNNLTRVDRASMAHSLEVRVPFLDHRIVEFAFSLPDDLCIRDGNKKYVLKNLLKNKVPDKIITKPKQGFSCPVGIFWPVWGMIKDIKEGLLVECNIIDRDALSRIMRKRNDSNWEFKIWLLAVLDKWCKHWLA